MLFSGIEHISLGRPSAPPGLSKGTSASSVEELREADVIGAVDDFLDLSGGPRDVFGALGSMDDADVEAFLEMLAQLLKSGVMGTEMLEVNGEAYKSFIVTRAADEDVRDAPLYRERSTTSPRIDLRA